MKKRIWMLLLCVVLCAACQPGTMAGSADGREAGSAMGTGNEESSADADIAALPAFTTAYEGEEALLAALKDEKALKEVKYLSEVRYWYKLKNIPEGYVEYSFRVLLDGAVRVTYVTEEAYRLAMEDGYSRPMAYGLPVTLQFSKGRDFEEETSRMKGGRFVADSIYYREGLGGIEWMEGEDLLMVDIPSEQDENLEYHVPKLTDEEVIAYTEVVRVDPFK